MSQRAQSAACSCPKGPSDCNKYGRGLRSGAGLSLEASPSAEQAEGKCSCICEGLLMGLMLLELRGQPLSFPRTALRKKRKEGEQWLSSSSAEEIKW